MKWYQMKWAQKYWGKAEREKYQQYLKSDAWKNKRTAILKKAGYNVCFSADRPYKISVAR